MVNKSSALSTAVIAFIAVVAVAIFLYFGIVSYAAFKVSDEVHKNGLKSVVETVWCGQTHKDCLNLKGN